MKTLFRQLTAVLIVASFTYSVATAKDSTPNVEAVPSQEVSVTDKQFGLFSITGEAVKFTPATTVPLVEDQAYGWRLGVKTIQNSVSVREEFELPAAPKAWNGVSEETVSNDRKTCTQTISLTPDSGYIQNLWSVASGDPAGNYVIRVFIDDKLVATFEFKVK